MPKEPTSTSLVCKGPCPANKNCYELVCFSFLQRLTYEQGVGLGDRHDAHDSGNAAAKGNQALQGVAGDVPEGSGRLAMHQGGHAPGQAGQVQPVHII